ncbi:hypothetical protein LEP1GSC036_0426 [Leptospira weilii str. 2006001853]|uniref:Uncharacterized protein n=1 Tax=Leptospira weilii str. 2006001853 TaxID=1001589 RepID=A0A828Z1W2_9LEPT|nr:hypothetical protein LEP1GSC036_0426 [Leptospira weilii str. 2006001853]EMN44770.1 hypothetical protein LEP1GSC086_0719 [Leptospira weilii str. LNT 1234]
MSDFFSMAYQTISFSFFENFFSFARLKFSKKSSLSHSF